MPTRHEDDFRRKSIRSWDSWIDEAIQEAQERGDFDNLPHQGKPIKIIETPFAPDMNAALTTLRNAGYAPTWMELDRELTQLKEEMASFLDRSTAYLRDKAAEVGGRQPARNVTDMREHPSLWTRMKRMLNLAADIEPRTPPQLTLDDLVMIRGRMREQYLERAARFDKKVTEFHAALPRDLWHLERMRLTPEQAARAFDAACPPLVDG